ncbi:MAG: hypothetical protein WCL32_13340, partial [Planctomycetota bacterium]
DPLGVEGTEDPNIQTAPKRPAWVTHVLQGDFCTDLINSFNPEAVEELQPYMAQLPRFHMPKN